MKSLGKTLEWTLGELPRPRVGRWASIVFSLYVLTLQISIAASQTALAAAAVLYAVHLLKDKPGLRFLPVKLPLGLFCIFSVLSIFWAVNPDAGWFAVRKLVLFVVWLLAVNLVVSARHLQRLLDALFLMASLTGLVAIVQFVLQYRDVRAHHPGEIYRYLESTRIHGFMGHWMNFGGQQMLVFAFLLAFLLLSNVEKPQGWIASPALQHSDQNASTQTQNPVSSFRVSLLWWILFAPVVIAIVLNFTRGVWLGCFVATIYLVARWKPRALWAMPVLLALVYVAAPSLVRERIRLAVHPAQEPALSIRLEMWQVALRMIGAHPWAGVGPNNIEEVYNLYLPPGKTPEVGYHNHFHNDYLQFAAERGLPCLASWLWLVAALGWSIWKTRSRLSSQKWIADAALAAGLAILVEGCFEFNFGTSPVLMLFLFVTSTPFVAERCQEPGLTKKLNERLAEA